MMSARTTLALLAVLLVLRAVMAALLPLSADEAYDWLWSLHLAAGYYDHPPMTAWLIRAGTALFGATPWGVRFAGVILSIPATWFVWQTAALVLRDEKRGRAGLAALFFNLTLMVSVEMLAATPDMPSLVTSAAMIWCLAQIQRPRLAAHAAVAGAASPSGRARLAPAGWWLGFGIAAGLGLLSKYSALFLGLGTVIWLIADPRVRHWLKSPWPYLGALLALAIFAPNLLWQSQHQWETFAFQFGRIGAGHFTWRFIGEFLAAQLGLATPLIFVLMLAGLWRASKPASDSFFLAVLVWTACAYFLEHALHDRVQGNWPCFVYPALAILAAQAFPVGGGWRKISFAAAPLAALMLLALYAQALWGVLPLSKDPLARILGRNFAPIGEVAAALHKAHLADAVLTTDYQTTAWLRFTQPGVPVVQVNETRRYPEAPAAPAALLKGRLIYLAEFRRDQHQLVQKSFGYMGFPTQLQTPASLYMLYPVGQPRTSLIGKMP
ncbi:MAG TPA: glycosyltransferase family 39 protein [Rhizomicrobium sp.]|jgi:4-amino-4-deoxy-L-arabinose transferase-like glycosyltransferase|nr:glycosyltransferase family 39 protein [Rhizomicrobium sp.]